MGSQEVINFRQRNKKALVEAFYNKCFICDKSYHVTVFEFHHIDPKTKKFGLSRGGLTRSSKNTIEEAKKCCMVCANCHRLIEYTKHDYVLYSVFNIDVYKKTLYELSGKAEKQRIKERNKAKQKLKKDSKKDRPTKKELKKLLREYNFLYVGRMYGVSDNAVRKWCDKFSIPRRMSEIKLISDKDWEKI